MVAKKIAYHLEAAVAANLDIAYVFQAVKVTKFIPNINRLNFKSERITQILI